MSTLTDKNGTRLNESDFICIDSRYLTQIIRHMTVGICIDCNKLNHGDTVIALHYLESKYQNKIGNTSGLIPLFFLNSEFIEKCNPNDHPELCM